MSASSPSLLAARGAHASAGDYLQDLNPAQRRAVEHGTADGGIPGPLLVVAGAGTGKTNTLAHRFAHLILKGADPRRMLLLTFTRRAAAEMTRRAQRILTRALNGSGGPSRAGDLGTLWAGTFQRSVTGSCVCMRMRSGSIRPSRCWTGPTLRTS